MFETTCFINRNIDPIFGHEKHRNIKPRKGGMAYTLSNRMLPIDNVEWINIKGIIKRSTRKRTVRTKDTP